MRKKVIGKYRWAICALLFFATTINYMDRQVLGLLVPMLSKEFNWSASDYGNITAIFSFVYAISMLFAGRVIDNIGIKRGYLLVIFVWSIGAIMHSFAVPIGQGANTVLAYLGMAAMPVSVIGFMIALTVLAAGESGNFPAAIKTTAEYFPKKERSIATGIFNCGANVGAVIGPLTVPWIAVNWGWEWAFIFIGALGFIWMVVWEIFYAKPEKQKRLSKSEYAYIHSDEVPVATAPADAPGVKALGWIQLLKYRQTWAFIMGKFFTDGIWFFYLFWLPKYLSDQYHLEKTQIGLPLAVLYSMTMVGSIGGGYFPLYYIKKGFSSFDARMRAMLMIATIPLLVLFAQPFGHFSVWVPVILIGIGTSAHQAWSANLFTISSDLFPKRSVGSVVGLGGMAGGLGGVIVTKTSGWITDYYLKLGDVHRGYAIMFGFCATAYIIAWFIMKALVPKYKQVTDSGELAS